MTTTRRSVAPAEAAVYGLAAGVTATLLISALARIKGIREHAEQASLSERFAADAEEESGIISPMSPAAVLARASGPGPEGPASLFAAKVASGLFGRDLAHQIRAWGKVVHVAYGTFWGLVYAMLQTRRRRRPQIAGAAHGLFVWVFGPALLVPAMKLTPAPARSPRAQTAFSVAAHLIYGVSVATLFDRLMGQRRHEPPQG